MDVMKLLEYLQEIIETASKVPVTGKIMLNKKEALDVVDEIIHCLPDEFKKAQWIVNEKERILVEAQRDAEIIKQENMDILKRHIENHDITREAKLRAEEIIASAQRDAKAMRLGARDYADEILCDLEKEIATQGEDMIVSVKQQVEEFVTSLEENASSKLEVIRENIKELRGMK